MSAKINRVLEQLKIGRKLMSHLLQLMQMKQVCCRLVASEMLAMMRRDAYAQSEAF
jgi:hypothetical protein